MIVLSESRDTLFGGSFNKDYSIWGYIGGTPMLGNTHIVLSAIGRHLTGGPDCEGILPCGGLI